MPRGNINNLIPNSERTPEELREQCKRAGKKSGEVRRAKADMRELMKLMLDEQIPKEKMTYGQSLTKSMLEIAKNPKQGAAAVRAYETILRITGQDEPEKDSGEGKVTVIIDV